MLSLRRSGLFFTALAAAALAATVSIAAEVRSTITFRDYLVHGTTPQTLVSYLRASPFPGDRGPALANVRAQFRLNLTTRQSGSRCAVGTIGMDATFTMTLPKATDEGRMSRSTRSAWRSFVAFARAHENVHRNIYLQCARNFLGKARRVTAETCWAVESEVRRLQRAEDAACEQRQLAFDRKESRRGQGLALFRAARAARR